VRVVLGQGGAGVGGGVVAEQQHLPAGPRLWLSPRVLHDPVMKEAEVGRPQFYCTTFWCNLQVFKCQQAVRLSLRMISKILRVDVHTAFSLGRLPYSEDLVYSSS
jgi:hypothetical protein